jgi:hypothetical protein
MVCSGCAHGRGGAAGHGGPGAVHSGHCSDGPAGGGVRRPLVLAAGHGMFYNLEQ